MGGWTAFDNQGIVYLAVLGGKDLNGVGNNQLAVTRYTVLANCHCEGRASVSLSSIVKLEVMASP